MNNIIITAILVVAFFMCISSYILGLNHGKQLSNGNIPKINLNPVKPIVEAVEQYKEKKALEQVKDELTDIMGASRETMLKAIKEEVK